MSKPAVDALNRIRANHPSAVVVERHESSITADVGDGKRALVAQIGAMHYDDNGWQEIDTAWQPAVGAWQHEMTTAPYQAYARDMLNAGNVVEYQAKTGESVTFQPLALNWRDINNSQQQIAIPQAVATQITGADLDVLSWPNGYGAGRHLTWTAHPTRLQKLLTIDTAGDLPAPEGYLGADVHLEMTFAFTVDASVDVYVDGSLWDKSSTLTTANHIEFRNVGGDTLWAFQQPKAWDSAGSETLGTMRVYQSGALHVAVRIPSAFVDAAVFPLFVDPTVTVSVTAGGDDYALDGASYFDATSTSMWVGTAEGTRADLGCVFKSVALPVGSVVTSCDARFTASLAGSVADTEISFEDADNPSAPTTYADARGRTRTTANVSAGGTGTAGNLFTTPSLAAPLQEVVDRAGWVSGNNVHLLWDGPSSDSTNLWFAAYEHSTYDPPSLYVEYTEGEPLTLTPNGFVSASGIVDQAAGTTNLHEAIDDSPDTSDGDTTYLVNSGNVDGHVWVELSNTPSDFDGMNAISVRVRVRRE